MIIALPKETTPHEKRVALTPEIVSRLIAWGYQVRVEKNAGTAAGFSDKDYHSAGAEIASDAAKTYAGANIVCKIWAPLPTEDKYLKKGMTVIANFQTLDNTKRTDKFAALGLTCFALEMIPRISRAQSMDILSSQSNLAGYKAVIEAVNRLDKAVPMLMTAAGTIPPAKVLILGAGVAGLQAVATAKRLGAQVYASDVRPQVKEQVESLGGRFLEIPNDENAENAGGYAKETSENYRKKQKLAVSEQLPKTDILITTALVPGKAAPRLIDKEMLALMPSGSIAIDMAASAGGNIEGSAEGKETEISGVRILGASNLASELPNTASRLFANNIYNFLNAMYDSRQHKIVFRFEDELVNKTCICKDGEIR
ncbi:MAG: Re/Si-specific NAD(P)(+) transhydrogenase subunit alpha [Alphaproteobacteria bacterium]|nr:Re/Si-specific NAD(P)(+) transhydrogenase subunit alpha [Alphaproteobacteria bacterium]